MSVGAISDCYTGRCHPHVKSNTALKREHLRETRLRKATSGITGSLRPFPSFGSQVHEKKIHGPSYDSLKLFMTQSQTSYRLATGVGQSVWQPQLSVPCNQPGLIAAVYDPFAELLAQF